MSFLIFAFSIYYLAEHDYSQADYEWNDIKAIRYRASISI